uniref:Uncharacterized protein n=1 Tax=Amphimedon queenslandica TaxID=400682 RepID=A0A1X7U7G3_AMPQE
KPLNLTPRSFFSSPSMILSHSLLVSPYSLDFRYM